jgi:hypothetical protein
MSAADSTRRFGPSCAGASHAAFAALAASAKAALTHQALVRKLIMDTLRKSQRAEAAILPRYATLTLLFLR